MVKLRDKGPFTSTITRSRLGILCFCFSPVSSLLLGEIHFAESQFDEIRPQYIHYSITLAHVLNFHVCRVHSRADNWIYESRWHVECTKINSLETKSSSWRLEAHGNWTPATHLHTFEIECFRSSNETVMEKVETKQRDKLQLWIILENVCCPEAKRS